MFLDTTIDGCVDKLHVTLNVSAKNTNKKINNDPSINNNKCSIPPLFSGYFVDHKLLSVDIYEN